MWTPQPFDKRRGFSQGPVKIHRYASEATHGWVSDPTTSRERMGNPASAGFFFWLRRRGPRYLKCGHGDRRLRST